MSSNWTDNETIHWKRNNNNMWTPVTNNSHILAYEGTLEDNYDMEIAHKWDELVGNNQSTISRITKAASTFQICTDKIQNDTGANRAVTNNKIFYMITKRSHLTILVE